MAEEAGELETAADINAARQAFLADPPPILNPDEPVAPVVADEDDIDGALGELTPSPAAPEGAPAPAPAPVSTEAIDPYAAYGGEEAVRVAHQVQEALRTREGINVLVANGLTALGYSPQQIKEALDAAAADGAGAPAPTAPAAADPLAGLEDDDFVPVSAVKTLVEQAAAAAAQQAIAATQEQVQPVQQAIQEQQAQQVRNNTDAAIVAVLGPVPTDPQQLSDYQELARTIVTRGANYYDPSKWYDPSHITQTVQRAHAEIEAEAEARYKAYLTKKKQARDSAPVNTGGGAGSDGPIAEPKNLVEARKQAEAAGFFK